MRYAFIRSEACNHALRRLCKMMAVHPSGYYAWRITPESKRTIEDRRLLGPIKQSWLESGGVYGYRKVLDDLIELGESCGKNRVHRLMCKEGIRAQIGYRRCPGPRGGPTSVVAPNHLQRQFDVMEPNRVWVTDITYIRTYEGWLYLAVVLDLFSRKVVGWSMQPRMDRELALNALLMAVWRRQPKETVQVHSDQGSQFSSYDWQDFLKAHNLQPSMSRRGNCHDNAVMESCFSTVKMELADRFDSCSEAKRELFDYIELFYNQRRRHSTIGQISPAAYERRARSEGMDAMENRRERGFPQRPHPSVFSTAEERRNA